MRTIRTKIYKFDELSKQAQLKALENWSYKVEYFGGDEAIESLTKFAEHVNCSLQDYSIDWTNGSYSSVTFDIPEDLEISRKELKTLIESMGSYNKKTLCGDGECKFTGVCFDEDAADGARKEFYINKSLNLKDILNAGWSSLYKACLSDYESQLSLEYFADHADANEYEFTKEGNRF